MAIDRLRRRLERLEAHDGGDAVFQLADGTTGTIRRRRLLDALREAMAGANTLRARIMGKAVSSPDNRLPEILAAYRAGPVPRGTINPESEDEQ